MPGLDLIPLLVAHHHHHGRVVAHRPTTQTAPLTHPSQVYRAELSGVFLALECKRHFPSWGTLLRPSPKFSLTVVETCWPDRPTGAKMPPSCPRELRSLALNLGGNLKRAQGRDPTGPGKCPQAPRPSAHSSRPTVAHSRLRTEYAAGAGDGDGWDQHADTADPGGCKRAKSVATTVPEPLFACKLYQLAETYRELFQNPPSALVTLVSNEISAAALHQH